METIPVIREMQETDRAHALSVLGKAFATNPNTIAACGNKPVDPRSMELAFAGRFKFMPGTVYVAEMNNRIVGAMRIVEWPGCQSTVMQNLRMMPSMLGALNGLGQVMRGMKLLGAWNKHDPKRPHWHVDPLGVDPEFQGKGIGSHMMKFYCAIIDKKGMEAYHETDRPENVPFYGKFGFNVVGEEIINGAKNWYLLRPARKP